MRLRQIGALPNRNPKLRNGSVQLLLPLQREPQTQARFDIFRIQRQGVLKILRRAREVAFTGGDKATVVVRLR